MIAGGRLVDDALFAARAPLEPVGLDSVKRAPVSAADFRVPVGRNRCRSSASRRAASSPSASSSTCVASDGEVPADLAQDAIKVAVVARHGKNENIGRGFVHGFGLKRGAIASSVGHDSHNITVVGVDDADMAAAVNRVIALQGGFVVAAGGEVRAELALPVAGLMSLSRSRRCASSCIALRAAATALGCTLPEPFLQVAFLPLPVIPHLKITDLGLFDVDRFQLWSEAASHAPAQVPGAAKVGEHSSAHSPATATVPMPPMHHRRQRCRRSQAETPARNSPSSFEAPTKTMFTALTRPRTWSGVHSWISVSRT